MEEQSSMFSLTIGSMYGISTNIYRKNELNVGKHSIHGSYRYVFLSDSERQHPVVSMLTSFFRRQTSPVAANSQKGRLEKAPFCRLFNDRWCCWRKKVLHHLGCIPSGITMDNLWLPINWCMISSINSMRGLKYKHKLANVVPLPTLERPN